MATERGQVYKCKLCGNMVEMLNDAAGTLTCCGQPMTLIEENSTDAAVEKHVPVVEATDGGTKVSVGSVAHPMQDDHYIEWIELKSGSKTCRQYLRSTDAPEATFSIAADGATARAYCNLHGLWKS